MAFNSVFLAIIILIITLYPVSHPVFPCSIVYNAQISVIFYLSHFQKAVKKM